MRKNPLYTGVERYCRRCINRRYRSSLRPEDCEYWSYMAKCSACGEICNIVDDLTPTGRWKLWFAKRFRSR